MNLKTPLTDLPGIGRYLSDKLSRLNLSSVEDLVHHYPFRYDDFSRTGAIDEIKEGEKVTLLGEIWSIVNVYTRFGKVITRAIFNDGTSSIELTWFNQSWLTKQIQSGDRLQISGKVSKYKNKLSIIAPVWEKMSINNEPDKVEARQRRQLTMNNSLHTGRLVPVYPETSGLTSKWIRTKIAQILPRVKNKIADPLPKEILGSMLPLDEALEKIHFPETLDDVALAKTRLGFDELFFIQLATQKARAEWRKKPSVAKLTINNSQLTNFISNLPFELTNAQSRVMREIISDLKKTISMNRLIQGEVGSGKTVVAAIIAYLVYLNKLRVLCMAPTEILAFQHFDTFKNLLDPFGVKVGIYTGSRKFTKLKAKSRKLNANSLSLTASPNVIIGTHALLSNKLLTDNVGLVIVDEQQRFGVEQRTLLRSKAKVPHFLTMSATPIPRTVALTLYGDLDLSIIDQLPKGRKLVKTFVVPSKKRTDCYKFIERKVKEGGQVYVITPLIEESETLVSVKAAKVEFEKLQKKVFPKLKLGLLHGRLRSKEKEKVMNDFRSRKIDILVSTSVVEVGMDIKNATIMVIEGAERFGLAQLHQLRGRVGRGEKESYCFLFPGIEEKQVVRRLKNLEKTYDGLRLAELDLKIRGGGEIFGTRQSGRFELKIARLSDLDLLQQTKEIAQKLLDKDGELDSYPQLKRKLASLSSVSPD